ncbi:MAG: alginate lyase family protein [Planctomycetota bacterium]
MSSILAPRLRRSLAVLASAAAVVVSAANVLADVEPADLGDGLILMDAHAMAASRERARVDPTSAEGQAVAALVRRAEQALDKPITTVVNKPKAPSSGDMRDYVSLSPYWWPNPDTEDGLPYVRRDGEVNPERDLYDLPALDTMTVSVRDLALAAFYAGDERFAENAAERLRVWFLDEEKRMNPRMLFGQFVPGVSEGRKFGIIETNRLRWTPDAVAIVHAAGAITDEELAGIKDWFDHYKTWLMTSDFGTGELAGKNNHGTWCAAQIALYASFAGDEATVVDMCEGVKERIAYQYEPDGSQPEELVRTRALEYSDFNNRAMLELAHVGSAVGVDLWSFETEDGRSLRKGIDFITPYMVDFDAWTYKQTRTPRYDRFAAGLRRASVGFNDPELERVIGQLPLDDRADLWLHLVLPLPADSFAAGMSDR